MTARASAPMAGADVDRVVPLGPHLAQRRLAAALAAEEAGDLELAFEECRRALEAAPRDARSAALAAVYAAVLERPRAALFYARRAMRWAPEAPPLGAKPLEVADREDIKEIAYWCGVARHIAGAHEGAIDALDLALTLDPTDEAARALRARCVAARA